VSKEAYLNFTLMLLALFGGLAVGGLLGMIYGPVIMILFMTTIDIYAKYFSDKGDQPAAVLEASEQEATLTPPGAPDETEA
jgi:predicted PurR-regulated permease PerM